MSKSNSVPGLVGAALVALVLAPPTADANVIPLDGALNYAILFEGTSNASLNFSNSSITGNVGIGNTGRWADAAGCSGQCQVMGVVQFSAANTGQFSPNAGTTYTPALAPGVNPLFSQSAVTTALNSANSYSSSVTDGTSIAFTNTSQTINESSGSLQTINGVLSRVFNVTSYSAVNATTNTIVGDGSGDPVVFNFASGFGNVNLGGSVVLTGLTPDQVLWNFQTTSQNVSLTNNGEIFQGIILAPNDPLNVSNAILQGRLIGGDDSNLQFVSGAHITAPPSPVPAPLIGHGLLVLLAVGGVLSGGRLLERSKRRRSLAA